MHSYKNLAVLALAASAISPALAAPTRESSNHARAELEARVGPLAAGLGGASIMALLPSLFNGGGLGSLFGLRSEGVERSSGSILDRETGNVAVGRDEPTFLDYLKALNTGRALDQRDKSDSVALINALSQLEWSKRADDVNVNSADLATALKLFGRALDMLD